MTSSFGKCCTRISRGRLHVSRPLMMTTRNDPDSRQLLQSVRRHFYCVDEIQVHRRSLIVRQGRRRATFLLPSGWETPYETTTKENGLAPIRLAIMLHVSHPKAKRYGFLGANLSGPFFFFFYLSGFLSSPICIIGQARLRWPSVSCEA